MAKRLLNLAERLFQFMELQRALRIELPPLPGCRSQPSAQFD
jgi:hypothetical protein